MRIAYPTALSSMIALALLLPTVVLGRNLTMTETTLPHDHSIAPSRAYQSSNDAMVWLETPTSLLFYAYNPATASLLSRHALPSNTANNNHVDQLYYDAKNNYIIGQMEFGLRGGVGAYYPHAFKVDGATAWENQTFSIHRNTVGGIGVVDGTVVLLQRTQSGAGFIRIVGADAQSGAVLYSAADYWQEVRCNPTSGVCVAVGYRIDFTSIRGFKARSGVTTFEVKHKQSLGPYTLSSIYQEFIVMTNGEGRRFIVDTTSGNITEVNHDLVYSHHGPNLYAERAGSNSRHYHVYSISQRAEILKVSFPRSGNLDGARRYSNYNVIVYGIENAAGTGRKYHFYHAHSGAFINAVAIASPEAGLNAEPFLVGSFLIIPTARHEYTVVDPHTGAVTAGTAAAEKLTTDLIYLASGETVMFNANSVTQFTGLAP